LRDPDRSLVRACLAGDPDAWEALIRRYERLLYAIPRRCGLAEEDAADVFQTVCVKLLENLERLREEQHLTAWLVTTARRESWRLYQVRSAQQATGGGADEEALEALPAISFLPEEEVLRLESAQLVRAGLEDLPERCRMLLGLLYRTDPRPSYEEIARKLNVSVGAIGPTRGRCLQQLRKILERMGF